MKKIKLMELFAGYGGASFALKKAGIPFELVGYSEIEPCAIKCFEQNHGGKNFGDCTKIVPKELPNFDLLTGGFPCQAFSVAGKMGGEADARGTLFQEIIRIAEVKKPKWMLLENVRRLTCDVFKPTFDKILSELSRVGYNVYWKVLNSKNYGIPQSRARIWFVCFRKDIDVPFQFQFPTKQKLCLSIKDILESEVNKKYYLSSKLQERFKEYINNKQSIIQKHHSGEIRKYADICPTLAKEMGGNSPYIIAMRQRDRHNLNEERQQQLELRDDGCSNSITSIQKDNLVYEAGRKELRTHTGLVPTLKERMGTGGNNVPLVFNSYTGDNKGGISGTLGQSCGHFKGKTNHIISQTITPAFGRGGHSSEEMKMIENNAQYGQLRRFTPKECFRLQGFINDEINLNNLSDSALYKLAGNGWEINLASKVLKQMFKNERIN